MDIYTLKRQYDEFADLDFWQLKKIVELIDKNSSPKESDLLEQISDLESEVESLEDKLDESDNDYAMLEDRYNELKDERNELKLKLAEYENADNTK